MAQNQAVIIMPKCIDDKVNVELRTVKVKSKNGDELVVPLFAYCPKCESYLTSTGNTKSELTAARDLYRKNQKALGNPRDIVSAQYLY